MKPAGGRGKPWVQLPEPTTRRAVVDVDLDRPFSLWQRGLDGAAITAGVAEQHSALAAFRLPLNEDETNSLLRSTDHNLTGILLPSQPARIGAPKVNLPPVPVLGSFERGDVPTQLHLQFEAADRNLSRWDPGVKHHNEEAGKVKALLLRFGDNEAADKVGLARACSFTRRADVHITGHVSTTLCRSRSSRQIINIVSQCISINPRGYTCRVSSHSIFRPR